MALPPTLSERWKDVWRDSVSAGIPESGVNPPRKAEIRALIDYLDAEFTVSEDTVKTIGLGGDFAEPGEFDAWIATRRILPGVTVTPTIITDPDPGVATVIACTLPVATGHIDGARIKWTTTNGDLNGAALTGPDFASLDSIWVIDSVTGFDAASVATAKAAAEVIVRAKYRVILEFDGSGETGVAMKASNLHAGDWSDCRALFIATDDAATVGAMTGTGINSGIGDGPGGVAVVPGSCFFGFSNACWLNDYGGIINAANGLALFGAQECARSDFLGMIYATGCMLIGAGNYGWRANHGGSAWLDPVYIRGCNNGIEVDNTPGMSRVHACDIQYCYVGMTVQYGGSAKMAFGATALGATTGASGDGTTATVTFAGGATPAVGSVISIIGIAPSGYAGQNTVTASSAGSVSFLSTQTGAQTKAGTLFQIVPAKIKNNARTQISIANGGAIDARRIDMATTATFPSNGGAAAPPPYGISVAVGGTAVVDDGVLTGHNRDLYMEGGTVSAARATIASSIGPSGVALSADANSIYSVYWPRQRGPQTKTADFTLALYEKSIINNKSSGCVVTLPDATTTPGRELFVVNTTAQTLVSASSNVVPKAGGSAGTAILPATSGAWAILIAQVTGTWKIVASGT